jgi:hypothetical protein
VKTRPAPRRARTRVLHADWGDARQYIIDVATGECAGEVVSCADFGFTAAETEAFRGAAAPRRRQFQEADNRAYEAMLRAAHTLVRSSDSDAPAEPKSSSTSFRKALRRHQNLLAPPAHANQFSNYLCQPPRERRRTRAFTRDTASKLVEEANPLHRTPHPGTRGVAAEAERVEE